jgi:hypothetical protein
VSTAQYAKDFQESYITIWFFDFETLPTVQIKLFSLYYDHW